mgnify:FL=1
MTNVVGISNADPEFVLSGVVDILRGGEGNDVAEKWVNSCTSSGFCISACVYAVNPREMVSLANLAVQQKRHSPQERRKNAFDAFRDMAQVARVVPRLQYPAEEIERINPRARVEDDGRVLDVLFYTGCNLIKTPHIAFLCLYVLERLGVSYRVVGGPSVCCGSFQWMHADSTTTGKVGYNTIDQLSKPQAANLLTWCPSCQLQLTELLLPSFKLTHDTKPIDPQPLLSYLEGRLEELKPHFIHVVKKRVALHERPAIPEINRAIRRVLSAIPGIELVELDVPRAGLMSNSLNHVPAFKNELREREFAAAKAAGVSTLATVYHIDHREICHFDTETTFEIVNFMELIGEAMGVSIPDLYKRLKQKGDVEEILESVKSLIQANSLSETEASAAIAADMFGHRKR